MPGTQHILRPGCVFIPGNDSWQCQLEPSRSCHVIVGSVPATPKGCALLPGSLAVGGLISFATVLLAIWLERQSDSSALASVWLAWEFECQLWNMTTAITCFWILAACPFGSHPLCSLLARDFMRMSLHILPQIGLLFLLLAPLHWHGAILSTRFDSRDILLHACARKKLNFLDVHLLGGMIAGQHSRLCLFSCQ